MKTALITTTVNVPEVLRLHRAIDSDVAFFVAGDEKTPHASVEGLFDDLPEDTGNGDLFYYSPEQQRVLRHACSDLIGFNCIQRRNIALLEALRWGADIIVSVDDDNVPMDGDYFSYFKSLLDGEPWNGLSVTAPWFDPGQLLLPPAPHRGLPIDAQTQFQVRPVVGAKVGVAAGLCLGDPDVSAIVRIALGPTVQTVSELGRSGVVFTPQEDSWTVFNSQNTAFTRELAPALFMPPGIGRYDDIVASLVCQRVMRERGLSVHFGPPFVWQQRNAHDLRKDLRDEAWGVENIGRVAVALDEVTSMTGFSVLDSVRHIYERLGGTNHLLPEISVKAALAFCDDVEKAMR
jgi:STELLO glycosyltransferases